MIIIIISVRTGRTAWLYDRIGSPATNHHSGMPAVIRNACCLMFWFYSNIFHPSFYLVPVSLTARPATPGGTAGRDNWQSWEISEFFPIFSAVPSLCELWAPRGGISPQSSPAWPGISSSSSSFSPSSSFSLILPATMGSWVSQAINFGI